MKILKTQDRLFCIKSFDVFEMGKVYNCQFIEQLISRLDSKKRRHIVLNYFITLGKHRKLLIDSL